MDPATIKKSGAGKAYQSVAQSMAIAIQDATDYQRNILAISGAAIGIATAKFAETFNPAYLLVIEEAQKLVPEAAKDVALIGKNAATILNEFPSS